MASTIKVKRSAVSGNAPNTSNIDTGELALNTADGILYSSDGSNVFEVGANLTSLSVTGDAGIGTTVPAGKLEIKHTFASGTDRLLYLNSSSGLSGGLASPVYGLYADIRGNNSATEIYGAYINAEPGTGDPTYGMYAQSNQTASNVLGVAVYASATVNSAASGQNPVGADPVAGVYAKASTTGTALSSRLTALTAHNESTYGEINYGAFIKSEVPTTPASTDSIPLLVAYGLDEMLTIHAQNGETVFNESGLDHNFRVESDTNANMLFVDAGNNRVGIGNAAPATALDVTGTITSDGLTVDGTVTVADGDITTSNGNITVDGNATFGDNNKAIFGAGSDLQIYHDGSNSYVEDAGVGVLNLKAETIRAGLGNLGVFDILRSSYTPGSEGLRISVSSSNQHEIKTLGARDLVLERNDDEKLRLTSTGVDITGTVTVTDGDINVANGTILIEGSAGSAGQVLTSDGTSASWQDASGGGGGFEQVFMLMGA